MQEVLFPNLNEIVKEKSRIQNKICKNKWSIIPYVCDKISGNLLLAGELTTPKNLTLKLNLKGLHKIYLSTINFRSKNLFYAKLSSDLGFSPISSPNRDKKHRWCPTEYAEEFLWKIADLTDEDLIIRKPNSAQLNACSLAWVRCVPITCEELENLKDKNKDFNLNAHFDEDFYAEDDYRLESNYLNRYFPLINSGVKEISAEFSFSYGKANVNGNLPVLKVDDIWQKKTGEYIKRKSKIYKKFISFAKENGVKIFVTNRMSVANFNLPYSNGHWTKTKFVSEHPEFYCETRLKQKTSVCSYAFKQVRDYVIENLINTVKLGFDGVSLIFHRGLLVGFEKPVIDRFNTLYPNVDPYILPANDKRLNGVWREIMTEFMRELRTALNNNFEKRPIVNVIVDYTPKTSFNYGLDINAWIKEDLIDGIGQGMMEVFEDLDGVLNKDGTIDLGKYQEKINLQPITKRYHGQDLDKALNGAKEYLELTKGSSVKFYAMMPWPRALEYEKYADWKKAFNKLGVKDFLGWNANHLMLDVVEFNSALNDNKEFNKINHYRTLKLNGVDLSEFNPNWRG